jgi:hypothetical protein
MICLAVNNKGADSQEFGFLRLTSSAERASFPIHHPVVEAGAVIVNDIISKADSEFKQGNFDTASELYGEALAAREGDASADELAELLQKLADADYAANKYEQARASFERLVALHDSGSFADKDRVMALLKLAKCSDKCANADQAESEFQAAYQLAQSKLTPKHYLNRSVCESYAEWLRNSGRNAERLAELEKFLGVEKKPAETKPLDEVTPDTVKLSSAISRPAGESEHFVLKKRLTKAKKAQPEPGSDQGDAAADQAGTEKAGKVLEKKGERTIDQQVAERKFLRKKDTGDAPESRTSMRAKLRSTLSDETRSGEHRPIEIPQDEVAAASEQFGMGDQQSGQYAEPAAPVDTSLHQGDAAAAEQYLGQEQLAGSADQSVSMEVDAGAQKQESTLASRWGQAAEKQKLYAPPPIVSAEIYEEVKGMDPSVARLMAKMPRRHMSDEMETARRKKKGVDLVVPSAAAKMAETSRQFLQHAEAVKKAADPDSEQAADLEQLRSEEPVTPILPVSARVASLMRFVSPVAGIILLIGASYLLYTQISTRKVSNIPAYAAPLIDQRFSTADDSVAIIPSNEGATVRSAGMKRIAKIHFWRDDLGDEISAALGGFKGWKFLQIVPEGLQDPFGNILYAPDAPERKTIAFIRAVADDAQLYYSTNADYPSYTTNLQTKSYANPFTNASEDCVIFSGVNQHLDGTHDNEVDTQLRNGVLYNSETAMHPGAVHAISLIGQPKLAVDGGSYNWNIHCFFIRGCDRHGKFLGGSKPGEVFLVTMKNGMPPQATTDTNSDYGDCDIVISQSGPPDPTLILLKYLGGLLFVSIFVWLLFRYTSAVRR